MNPRAILTKRHGIDDPERLVVVHDELDLPMKRFVDAEHAGTPHLPSRGAPVGDASVQTTAGLSPWQDRRRRHDQS